MDNYYIEPYKEREPILSHINVFISCDSVGFYDSRTGEVMETVFEELSNENLVRVADLLWNAFYQAEYA